MTDPSMLTAAAMHGIALNAAYTDDQRLGAALQALDVYEKRIEQLEGEIGDEIVGSEETTDPPVDTEPHLTPTITDRGFKHMPSVDGRQHESVSVYESSLATEACIWLQARSPKDRNDPTGPVVEQATVELTVEAAVSLAEQIEWLVRNHYQLTLEG